MWESSWLWRMITRGSQLRDLQFHQKNRHQSRCNKAREENEKRLGGEQDGGDLLPGLPGEGTWAGLADKAPGNGRFLVRCAGVKLCDLMTSFEILKL